MVHPNGQKREGVVPRFILASSCRALLQTISKKLSHNYRQVLEQSTLKFTITYVALRLTSENV